MRTARSKLNENETPNTIEDFQEIANKTKSPIEITAKGIINPPERNESSNDFEVEENFNPRPQRVDKFSRWLSEYAAASEYGWFVQVTGLPDFISNPKASITPVYLGVIPFNRFTLVAQIQELNSNRGGKFALTILNEHGEEDENSYVEVAIPHPSPKEQTQNGNQENTQLMQVLNRVLDRIENLESNKSDSMEEMKKTLELMGMMRSAFGVNESHKSNSFAEAIAHLPQDQQVQMLTAMNPTTQTLQTQIAVQQANVLSDFISTLAENARNSANPSEPSNFDKILDTVKSSPELMRTVGLVAENVVKMAAYAMTPKENRQFGNQVVRQPVTVEQPVQVQNPQVIQSEIIDAQPIAEQPQIVEVPAIEKGDYNVMMDAIIEVLQSDDPITLQHEILVGLKEDYPVKFPMIKAMVKATPFEQLKEFIKGFLPDEDLHLLENEKIVARLQELHNLIINES